MLSAILKILEEGNIDELMTAMREYGLSPESPEWKETLRIWREERERRQRFAPMRGDVSPAAPCSGLHFAGRE